MLIEAGPDYPDTAALNAVEAQLAKYPPLVFAGEARRLKAELGKVAAGTPIDALENPESVSVPQEMIGRGKHFALEVQGDSMIEDAICDGDILVVASRESARPGQTVVALVDGESATVKRYRPEPGGWISLEPANEKYKPIRVRGDQVQIRGIVAGVIRRYNVN